MLKLELGSNLNPDDIEEGDDVYFECKVHSNPWAYKVVWKHNVSKCFSSEPYHLSQTEHESLFSKMQCNLSLSEL
jgi:hypothetical protein